MAAGTRSDRSPWPPEPLRVLTVLLDVPAPARTGLHHRQLTVLRLVRTLGCQSHVLVFTTEERPEVGPELGGLCDAVHLAGRRVEYASLSRGRRLRLRGHSLGAALLSRGAPTYPFSVPYDLADAAGRLDATLRAVKPGAVILPTTLVHLTPRASAGGARVIGDAADIVSQLTRRVIGLSRTAPWRLPGLVANHVITLAQERLFLETCSEVWASTPGEALMLRQRLPGTRVVVAGNAIDDRACHDSPVPSDGPIGMIGNYSLSPNRDAANFLATRVFPLVQRSRPSARLVLAGPGMPPGLGKRLARLDGVQLLGPVADALAFTESCRVMAPTVRLRAGAPLKLIEALACARPVVTTHAAIAGLPLEAGRDVLAADRPEDLAEVLCRVLSDDDLASSLARRGRQLFLAELSFAANLRRVREQSLLAMGQRTALTHHARQRAGGGEWCRSGARAS